MKTHIRLLHRWALGDTVLLSGLVRDLHLQYGNDVEISVDTHYEHLWQYSPRLAKYDPHNKQVRVVQVSWGQANKSRAMVTIEGQRHMRHILAWYHHDFARKSGLQVTLTEPRGELFTGTSCEEPLVDGRYWLVMAGGKPDITNKLWSAASYQAVVDGLAEHGIPCVQGGASFYLNSKLENCLNLVGSTNDIFDLFNLVKFADGVITPVSAAMHIAAIFQRPCVVIAGGREEPWFEWYGDGFEAFGPGCAPVKVPHKFLHTLNQLPCCANDAACWTRKVVRVSAADRRNKSKREFCLDPVLQPETLAKCMTLIQPSQVIEAAMEYYKEEILPPISAPRPAIEPTAGSTPASPAKVAPQVTIEPFRPATLRMQRPGRAPARAPEPIHQLAAPEPTGDSLDHPLVGGRFTVCVLCYGPHPELHRRCLDSILETLPRNRMDLRVGCNAVPRETLEYLQVIQPDAVYNHPQNVYKDAVMREMFHDPQKPLTTNYLVWFDDDTRVVDPKWATVLADAIIANHNHGCRLYGDKRFHDLSIYARAGKRPDLWFRQASWWQGLPLRMRGSERYSPNGSCLDFVVGYFWAIHVPTIAQAQIPDVRLVQAGDDIVIGEQVHQAGGKIKGNINVGMKLVWCPSREQGGRREFSKSVMVFPWAE